MHEPPPPIPTASRAAAPTLPYSGPRPRRAALWRVAPRRCAVLGAAWALALGSLFLPGCRSGTGSGDKHAPTYVTYSLSVRYVQMYASGDRGKPVPAAACALFPVGAVAFLFTPLLLWRRVFARLGAWGWATGALLGAPWILLITFAAAGAGANFLYGFYLLALAHTLAFAAIAWPPAAP